MPMGAYSMLKAPRKTNFFHGFQATPTLGPKLCQSSDVSKLSPPPLAYTTAPGMPRLGSTVVRSKLAQWPYFSCSRNVASHRRPRFNVSFGVTFQLSCANRSMALRRPYRLIGVVWLADWTSPSRKLANPKPTWLPHGWLGAPVVLGLKPKLSAPEPEVELFSMARKSPPNIYVCLPFVHERVSA